MPRSHMWPYSAQKPNVDSEELTQTCVLKVDDVIFALVHDGGHNSTEDFYRRVVSCVSVANSFTWEEAFALTLDRDMVFLYIPCGGMQRISHDRLQVKVWVGTIPPILPRYQGVISFVVSRTIEGTLEIRILLDKILCQSRWWILDTTHMGARSDFLEVILLAGNPYSY
ncbi:hypothetical protein P154DRAFT_581173 [Amniculicola lignicola CBS 123094]|uniref:Uncharacterized protein n=1 Tax=Amniculicola lignicola CBS 123094 TaxID=1392246 RepID=A0A6A5W1G4_9PLEO|nr:hypothetical protein P154DRAFT_581173 [Amniculicola lignicola CBS 123094]